MVWQIVASQSPAGCESTVSSADIVERCVHLCLRYRALSMVLPCLDNWLTQRQIFFKNVLFAYTTVFIHFVFWSYSHYPHSLSHSADPLPNSSPIYFHVLCVCVCECAWVKRPEVSIGYLTLSPRLFLFLFPASWIGAQWLARLPGQFAPGFCGSLPRLLPVLGYRSVRPHPTLTWVLGLQTQVLFISSGALSPLRPLVWSNEFH